ncbi:MAG: hypothetical protein HOI80_02585, partial [Alphaproteobacteria bacterium]|nr:hypothetical protein [Alphaproteobacteria bacterium]
ARIIAYTKNRENSAVGKGAPIFLIFFKGQVVPRSIINTVSNSSVTDMMIYNKVLIYDEKKPNDVPEALESKYGDIKENSPIVIPITGEDVNDAVHGFLKAVDAIYARGKLEPETQVGGAINKLYDLLTTDPPAGDVFAQKMQDIFDFDALKGLTEDRDALEVSDFEKLFNNFESLYSTVLKDADTSAKAAEKLKQIRQALVATYEAAQNDDLKKALATTLRASKATGAVRATGGTTSGYRIGSTSASGGSVDFQVMEAFGNAFPAAGSLTERVNQFNGYVQEVNQLIANKNKVPGGIEQKFSKFIVLDLLQQILYDFEASSAGWVFESFLAFMAFGEAIGAGYGAGDFTIKNADGKEIEGSAKLLQTGKTGQNFANVNNGETIRYVIGVKETQVTDKTTTPTKQGQRTGLLKIYIMDLTRTTGDAGDESGNVLVTQGSSNKTIDISDGRITIEVLDPNSPDAELDLLFLQANEFQDISGRIVNDISTSLKQSMEKMSSLKANIDDYVLNYSQEDERMIYSKGALEDYGDLQSLLFPKDDKLFGGTLTEQKITANFLKNLISESFKR